MIGVIVVGHGNFASELVSISESILGKQKNFETININSGEGEYAFHKKIEALIDTMKIEDLIILCDIYGGSISNMCLYFAKLKDHVAVVSGVNVPMIIKVLTYRDRLNLKELISMACKGGKDGIMDACEMMDKTKDKDKDKDKNQ